MSEFIDALQKAKGGNELNILRNVINKDIFEKGKAGQVGEIRTWGGKKYQKTAKGWRPVSKREQYGVAVDKRSDPRSSSARALDEFYLGQVKRSEKSEEKSKKTEGSGKEKKLTVKERDSQNISKVQDILKRAGIESSNIKVHRWNEGRRTYDYVGAERNPYRFSLDGNTGQFTFTWGTQDSMKGDINNEEHVKAVRNHIKGNDILNKMRDALKGDQKNMASLIKELQELF